MKKILILVVLAGAFVAGCEGSEGKNDTLAQQGGPARLRAAAPQGGTMAADIEKTADDIEKDIDTFSTQLNQTAAVLRKRLPAIIDKLQRVMVDVEKEVEGLQNATTNITANTTKTQ